MPSLLSGALLLVLAGSLGLFVVFRSRTPRLPRDRRRPPRAAPANSPTRLTGAVTEAVTEFLERRGWTRTLAGALELAGIRSSPADFLVLVAVAAVFAALVGLIAGGALLGLLFLIAAPLVVRLTLSVLTTRRKRLFTDQLDGTLQLLAGSLRVGHSLLRAVDAVAQESPAPTSEELARVVDETRLGRELDESLHRTARRMESQDFSWVAQASGIHREVGGDLAEVLDRVAATIRERNQIKRQVRALSAEGRMSAYVLMALPVLIAGILSLIAPEYIGRFLTSGVHGYGLIVLALLMFAVGGLWMARVVRIRF